MFKKLFLTIFCITFFLISTFTYGSVHYLESIFENKDLVIFIDYNKEIGNHVADLVEVDFIIEKRDPTVKIHEKSFPKEGILGDFEIRDFNVVETKKFITISYILQSFIPPQENKILRLGRMIIYYTTDKYWSSEDSRFVYRTIKIYDGKVYQVSIDPDSEYNLEIDEFYILTKNMPKYIPISLMILGISINLFIIIGLLIEKYKDNEIKKIKKLLKSYSSMNNDELKMFNTIIFSSNLMNIIRKLKIEDRNINIFLNKILYENYNPKVDELRNIIKLIQKKMK